MRQAYMIAAIVIALLSLLSGRGRYPQQKQSHQNIIYRDENNIVSLDGNKVVVHKGSEYRS